MRDEDTSAQIMDMSIQEVNGKGPRKRKKSADICDSEGCKEGVLSEYAGEEKVACAKAPACVELLHWRDMPPHLQFNPYVLTGYRPLQSFAGCIASLFYFHNETINILTHGVSLVYMMLVLPGLLPWGGGGPWFLSLCHLLGAMAPWCGSFIYHLFMNHTRGAALYHRLLQLDMLGIWVSQSIGAIPMVTATVYCAPALLRYGALAVYCLGSILGLYKAMRAWSPWERRLCFAAPFCMRLLLAGARAGRYGGGDPQAILHVFLQFIDNNLHEDLHHREQSLPTDLSPETSPTPETSSTPEPIEPAKIKENNQQKKGPAQTPTFHPLTRDFFKDAVSLGGGVIGAMHIPEKWFPGTVDRCLNSHNIMHVLVVLAVYSMHQVTRRDLAWMSRVDCCAPEL